MAVIRAIDVEYSYPDGTEALRGVSLEARRGEKIVVLGPNGSGKTTLLLILAGLLKPTRGTVLLEGRPLHGELPKARRRFGVLFQDPEDQLIALTVGEDIALGPRQLGLGDTEVERRVREVAKLLGIEGLLERSPHKLSGGEKKLAALAGIMAVMPDIIVLDEPTTGLSPSRRRVVEGVISSAARNGATLIIATHDVGVAYNLTDRVYILRDGRVVAAGGRELLLDEELLRANDLEQPLVLRLYSELVGGPPPRSLEEAALLIDRRCG